MKKREEKAKEALQLIADEIENRLPKNYGFCLLVYDFGKDQRLAYVSNSNREDVIQAMMEFIKKHEEHPENFGKDVE